MPVILAIETTQRSGGVALRDATGKRDVEALASDRGIDDDLMPAIDRLFRRASLRPADLDAVGVSIGPGGFTGLRIAVSTTKVLAYALDALVVSVPTAVVVVEGTREAQAIGDTLLVALASKGETFWSSRVTRSAGAPWRLSDEPDHAPRIADAEDCPLDGVDAVLGDRYLPEAFRSRCAEADVPIVEPVFDPSACLVVTERRLAAGRTCDPLHLAPVYPRRPEAERLWELRHGRG